MSFNQTRKNKNRNLNANYDSAPSKIEKPVRMKNASDKSQGSSRFEGVYSNSYFMYANTSLIGTLANIVNKDGDIYEGIFNTFSSDFEIVLNTVSKVEPKAENNVVSPNIGSLLASLGAKNEFMDTVIFNLKDIVMMSIPNVNLDFAIKGNFTDTEISKFNPNLLAKERDLVPWDCTDDCLDDSLSNDLILNDDGDSGWDPKDMFQLHEKKYNTATTYTESMEGYTVPLDKNADDYEEREAEANRIAQLIENDMASKDRLAKEDGDEEDKFSAVVRPNANEHNTPQVHINKQTNNNQNNQNLINQSHSRHDNLNNRSSRNKNNPNTASNLNSSGNFSANNSLNRSKNQSSNNSNNLQQSQSYHSFSSRSNGPMNNNRLNSRLDQQQHNHHEDKDLHHRNERLMHNDHPNSQTLPSQRSQHNNNNSNNRRLNNLSMVQKREETTHDLKKFSSNFKMNINQQQDNQLNDRISGNKEMTKEVKQSNMNKPIDNKDQNANNQNKASEHATLSLFANNKSTNKDNEDSQSINRPANRPLLDKPPKDKSSSYIDKPLIVSQVQPDTLPTDKVNNKQSQQSKQDHQAKSIESTQTRQQQSVDTTSNKSADNESQTQDYIKQEKEGNSMLKSTLEITNNQALNDSGKATGTSDVQNTERIPKKSTLNPNAKEFVFNPKANPYTPKTYVNSNTYQVPLNSNVNANMPPSSIPPNVNPQLTFQANAHHLAGHPGAQINQPTANSGAMPHSAHPVQQQIPIAPMGPIHQGANQQLITSVLHPGQQPLMAHHPAGAQVHHHQMHQGAHQILPFPTHLMSQSIQFAVQTNPQSSMHHHPHPQNPHHPHHQTSPYIIPAIPNQVTTANLPPNGHLTSANSNAISYVQPGAGPPSINQPPNQPLNTSLVNPQQAGGSNQPTSNNGGGQRSVRSKTGQYHNHNQSANTNQRSNPNNQQTGSNQAQISGNLNQLNIPNVAGASASAAVYTQQPIHLPPNFSGSPSGVNPGTYQIYHHPQFQAHQHAHHTRLMSPQGLGMVHPGMTAAYATPTADPAFQQIYSNYMTNMTGVPQFVAVPPSNPPASVSSPIHLSHLGSNTMINNIGVPVVVSTHLGTPTGQSNVPRPSNTTNSTSNVSTSQQISTSQQAAQPQQVINNGAGQYAQNALMPFIIAQPTNIHSGHAVAEQTSPPN